MLGTNSYWGRVDCLFRSVISMLTNWLRAAASRFFALERIRKAVMVCAVVSAIPPSIWIEK